MLYVNAVYLKQSQVPVWGGLWSRSGWCEARVIRASELVFSAVGLLFSLLNFTFPAVSHPLCLCYFIERNGERERESDRQVEREGRRKRERHALNNLENARLHLTPPLIVVVGV